MKQFSLVLTKLYGAKLDHFKFAIRTLGVEVRF